jgi:hypothetical protein
LPKAIGDYDVDVMSPTNLLGLEIMRCRNNDEPVEQGPIDCNGVLEEIGVVNAYLNRRAADRVT